MLILLIIILILFVLILFKKIKIDSPLSVLDKLFVEEYSKFIIKTDFSWVKNCKSKEEVFKKSREELWNASDILANKLNFYFKNNLKRKSINLIQDVFKIISLIYLMQRVEQNIIKLNVDPTNKNN